MFEQPMTGGTLAEDFEFSVVWPDDSRQSTTEATSSSGFSVGVIEREAAEDDIVTQFADGRLEFMMPPLMLSDEPELADAAVPDDVAEAVRRAIAAIESVSAPAPADVEPEKLAEPGPTMVQAPSAALGGFAPPTMATRAEVLYGLIEDDNAVAGPTLGGSSPAAGVGGVFVEDRAHDSHGGSNERSSALRRLIGSLRRKDH
jgi:hypothetical protein